jgi:hypothetical protein
VLVDFESRKHPPIVVGIRQTRNCLDRTIDAMHESSNRPKEVVIRSCKEGPTEVIYLRFSAAI